MVPNTNLDNNLPDLFPVENTFDIEPLESYLDTSSTDFLEPPPEYSPSGNSSPPYQLPWRRETVLRRIRILQSEATALYQQIDQIRSHNILLHNEAVNTQL